MSGSLAHEDLDQLEKRVRQLRRRLALAHPLEEQEIWDRACQLQVQLGLPLEQSVIRAEREIISPDLVLPWPSRN